MVGAIVVAAFSVALTLHGARWFLGPIYRLATCIYRTLFGRLIALGWVRE
jgi:undecaprenyl-diphosphatase